jgi:hypothetical protein
VRHASGQAAQQSKMLGARRLTFQALTLSDFLV